MVQFRVRAQSLGEVSAQLQSVISVFDANVAEVGGTVGGIVNASWIGEDAENFTEQWTAWNESAVLVRLALTSLAAQLAAADGSYTTTETSMSGGFTQRRQANAGAAANTDAVRQSVDVGRERANNRPDGASVVSSGQAAAVFSRGGGGSGPDGRRVAPSTQTGSVGRASGAREDAQRTSTAASFVTPVESGNTDE